MMSNDHTNSFQINQKTLESTTISGEYGNKAENIGYFAIIKTLIVKFLIALYWKKF